MASAIAILPEQCPAPELLRRAVSQQTILIVEDDVFVRRPTCELLTAAGHNVLEATNVAGARRIFDPARIELVVCDAMLPDGSGIELCRHFRAGAPQLRVVLTSGYPMEFIPDWLDKNLGHHFLNKPYSGDSLLAVVHRTLAPEPHIPEALLSGAVPHRLQNLPGELR